MNIARPLANYVDQTQQMRNLNLNSLTFARKAWAVIFPKTRK